MRFSCEKTVLNNAISICAHAVSAKSTSQVLEGLLIVAQEQVVMSGFNYKIGIQKSFEADITKEGAIVIHARLFADIIRKMPDGYIDIDVDENLIVTISCGISHFTIVGTPAQEYPELPEVVKGSGITLSNKVIKKMINSTVFAVSDNENKPIHTGSLFDITDNTLTMVAVDGYRLALHREEIAKATENQSFVVPGDALRELARILPDNEEDCAIYPERKHTLFEFDQTIVTTRLLEGEFLNYQNSIPTNHPIRLTVSTNALITSVERVSLIVSERLKNPIHCVFDGSVLKLSCTTAQGRSYDECIISECNEKIEIGFNNRYLLDALKACPDDEVILEIKSGLSPCNICPVEGNKYLHMVLPVRLKAGE